MAEIRARQSPKIGRLTCSVTVAVEESERDTRITPQKLESGVN